MRILFFCVLMMALFSVNLKAQDYKRDKWQLVWSEEFDKDGLPDPATWGYEVGFVRNKEAQYYTNARKENARVENGNLVIESIKEDYKGAKYTSASINTLGKVDFQYGLIEVRAKIPGGRGIWPAIWMLGTNRSKVGWPKCGEIDIMEYVGYDVNTVYGTVHTETFSRGKQKGGKIKTEKPFEGYHLYAVAWYKDRIDFMFDGEVYFTFKNPNKTEAEWPYDKPSYLLLNTAVGGSWGGAKGIDDNIFPKKYFVDYVRYYKQKK
ncbi:hypothetical protein FUAX_51820 (plasmid) [Fulvitalea axinellae]|uniref:GH16 domain-containing protein n=1 Tax=Fulvitalea axinellae TaxID=1182444 RepID=A0AAU9DJR9_9BACT|nr:hypothetical protein FUAX_51820 [Fulvitalea axinellae]